MRRRFVRYIWHRNVTDRVSYFQIRSRSYFIFVADCASQILRRIDWPSLSPPRLTPRRSSIEQKRRNGIRRARAVTNVQSAWKLNSFDLSSKYQYNARRIISIAIFRLSNLEPQRVHLPGSSWKHVLALDESTSPRRNARKESDLAVFVESPIGSDREAAGFGWEGAGTTKDVSSI